jgi:hypothetical protein
MTSYSARYAASAASVGAQQTRQTVNQNITRNQGDVRAARNQEAQRQAQGKPPARTP